MMMILPSRSDSWACYGLFGSLSTFRFSCSVGKKLGLVALPPHVLPFAQAFYSTFSSLTNSAGLAPDFAGLATWTLRPRCKGVNSS
jgi:hypothetical protein